MQSKNPWFLALVVFLTGLSVWLYQINPYKFGLDVKGGARFIYQIKMDDLSEEQRENPAQVQSRVKRIIENRASGGLGVAEPLITARGVDQLIVELPDIEDIDQARAFLKTTAKIQVYHARNVTTPVRTKTYSEAGQEQSEAGSPYVTFYRGSDSSTVLEPGDPEYARMIEGWDLILEGEEVENAYVQVNNGQNQPHFEWSTEGSEKMVQWSRRYNSAQENLAFVLDGVVLNIAPLERGAILRDSAFINGDFEPDYINSFVDLINSGSLPAELVELASQTVDPTIGQAALEQMVVGGVISLGIICGFLIFYYSFPGVVATIAMILYTLFTLTVLKMMGATFSLASIAGFILSAGMAVDANVLVFERIKEELRAGRKTMTAIELGFRRALTAIVDSNLCTVITSLVLWIFGTGPVKGFATTLIVGTLISFFTAITITRSLLVGVTGLGKFLDPKWFAMNRRLFGEQFGAKDSGKRLQIIGNRNRYFILSAALIVVGMAFVALGGIKPNVEFQGGFEAQYRLTEASQTVASVRSGLANAGFEGANIKTAEADGSRWVYITLPQQEGLDFGSQQTVDQIAEAAGVSAEGASIQEIGPAIAAETVNNAIMGVAISSVFIVLYLAVRFGLALGGVKNGMKFGLSALATLLHDVVFIIGIAGVVGLTLGWEISALFITAMLTVIGFSVHDTIVIFDRIRENLKRAKSGVTFEELVDDSINQSVTRSLITSLTAVFPLAVLLFVGTPTPELKFMVLAMLMGIVVGTYSSIFNAAPILYLWNKKVMASKGEQYGLMQEALRENKIRASAALATATAAGPADVAVPEAGAYGTIKRKRSVRDQASVELDDDD